MQQRQASHTSSAAHMANGAADQLTTTGQAVPQFVRAAQPQTTTTTTTTGNYPPAIYGQTVTTAAGEHVTTYQAPTQYTIAAETTYKQNAPGTYTVSGGDHATTAYQTSVVSAPGERTVTTYLPGGETNVTTYQEAGALPYTTTTTTAGDKLTTTEQPLTTYTTMPTYQQAPASYTQGSQPHQVTTTTHTQTSQQPSGVTYQQTTYSGAVQYSEAPQYVVSNARTQGVRQTEQMVTQGQGLDGEVVQSASQHATNAQRYVSRSQASEEAHGVVGQHATSTKTTHSLTTIGTRVIGRETGAHRLRSTTERVDESRSQILSENVIARQIRIPKRIVREELIEKVIIVPEKKLVEEFVDEIQTVKETVIEVAKPTIVEKIIEVPEIEIIERLVEVPEKKIEERIVHVEKIIEQERMVGEPEIVYQDKIVDVPVPEEKWTDVYVDVEVPEWRDEIRTREVRVPQYKEVPVPRQKNVEVPVDVHRDLPVPVEAEVSYEYRMPQLKPRYARVGYPVYLPRFIEVPVAAEMLNAETTAKAQKYLHQVSLLIREAASMCEIEGLAADILKTGFQKETSTADLQNAVLQAWKTESIGVKGDLIPQKVEAVQMQPAVQTMATVMQARSIPVTSDYPVQQ